MTPFLKEVLQTVANNVVTVIVFAIALLLSSRWYRHRNLPPGPWGLPFIGIIPFVGTHLHKTMITWSKKYGDVFSFYLGPNLSLAIHGYENIKEAFVKHGDHFSGRELMFMVKDTRGKYTGVLINQDKAWQQHRRFLERIFRELGVAKSTWESNIHDELNHFLAEITSKNGEAFDIHQLLNMSVANVTNKIILGDRFEYSDESFQRHVKMIDDIMNNWQLSVFFNMYPWTRLLPGDPTNYFTLKKWEHSRQYDVIQPMIDKRKTECEKNGRKNDKDIIGYYLNALEEKDKLVKYSTFEMLQLRCIIDDLFFAGTETTSTTMRWALLYMIKYPHIQEKVRQEIFDNIGKGRLPSLNDRESLPYTEAVLLEIQRYNSIVPLAVPHQTTADVTFKGYHIPKGVLVYPNLWALHRDPTLWKNPNIFDPLRFLDENGHVVKPPHFMPFSIGKRICAGEVLAKSEMFLYFSTMMQRFNFTFPNGQTTPSMEGVLGITLCPEPFKLCATRI